MSKSADMLQFFSGLCIIGSKQYEVRVKGSTPINIWPPLPQCLPQGAQAMWFQIRFKSWKLDLKLCQHCVWVRGNVCQAGQSSSPPQKSRSHWVPPQPSREAHEGQRGTGICQNLNQLIFAIWNCAKTPFSALLGETFIFRVWEDIGNVILFPYTGYIGHKPTPELNVDHLDC